ARAGGGDAHAHLTGELRLAARHEGRHLLVADLDQLRVAAGAVEGAEEGVDPVTGVAVDAVDAPLAEALEREIGNELGHGGSFRIASWTGLPGPGDAETRPRSKLVYFGSRCARKTSTTSAGWPIRGSLLALRPPRWCR